jgi:hypothetical protein
VPDVDDPFHRSHLANNVAGVLILGVCSPVLAALGGLAWQAFRWAAGW